MHPQFPQLPQFLQFSQFPQFPQSQCPPAPVPPVPPIPINPSPSSPSSDAPPTPVPPSSPSFPPVPPPPAPGQGVSPGGVSLGGCVPRGCPQVRGCPRVGGPRGGSPGVPCPPVPQWVSSEPSGQSGCRSQRLWGCKHPPPLGQGTCGGGQGGDRPPARAGGLAETGGVPVERVGLGGAQHHPHLEGAHIWRRFPGGSPHFGGGGPRWGLTTMGLVGAVGAVGVAVAGHPPPRAEQPGQGRAWGAKWGEREGQHPAHRTPNPTAPTPQHPHPTAPGPQHPQPWHP